MPAFGELNLREMRNFVGAVVEPEPMKDTVRHVLRPTNGGYDEISIVVPASLREYTAVQRDSRTPEVTFQQVDFDPKRVYPWQIGRFPKLHTDETGSHLRYDPEHRIKLSHEDLEGGELSVVTDSTNLMFVIVGQALAHKGRRRPIRQPDVGIVDNAINALNDSRVYGALLSTVVEPIGVTSAA